ncbi:MAG: Hsp20/alpha crystallin family protein [Oscillospiraceae bacterium]
MRNYLTPFERKGYDFFNAMHDFERDFFGETSPMPPINSFKVDIRDTGDGYILEAELPGFEKEEIKVNVSGDTLTLTAEHVNQEKEEKSQDGKYIRRERSFGKYQQSFDVSNINTDNISAEYKNGVLTLDMPKKTPSQPITRQLEIK